MDDDLPASGVAAALSTGPVGIPLTSDGIGEIVTPASSYAWQGANKLSTDTADGRGKTDLTGSDAQPMRCRKPGQYRADQKALAFGDAPDRRTQDNARPWF